MKRIALLIAVMGLFVLGLLMLNLKAVEVGNEDDLKKLEVNTKVIVEGRVAEERVLYLGTKLLIINDLEVICECSESFKGRRIRVEGLVDEFNGKRQVRVLKIEVFG